MLISLVYNPPPSQLCCLMRNVTRHRMICLILFKWSLLVKYNQGYCLLIHFTTKHHMFVYTLAVVQNDDSICTVYAVIVVDCKWTGTSKEDCQEILVSRGVPGNITVKEIDDLPQPTDESPESLSNLLATHRLQQKEDGHTTDFSKLRKTLIQVFYGDLFYKLRRVKCEANFASSGSK